MEPTPPKLLRDIQQDAKKGGTQAEQAYRQFHVEHGAQPLRKKYRG